MLRVSPQHVDKRTTHQLALDKSTGDSTGGTTSLAPRFGHGCVRGVDFVLRFFCFCVFSQVSLLVHPDKNPHPRAKDAFAGRLSPISCISLASTVFTTSGPAPLAQP